MWRKSLRSVGNGACAEVNDVCSHVPVIDSNVRKRIEVRDSRDWYGFTTLCFTPEAWRAFIKEVKDGSSPVPGMR